jgi:hypothetical protein
VATKKNEQPHAKGFSDAPQPALRSKDTEGNFLQITSNAQWSLGNRNAWKHGHYSAENISLRSFIQALARLAKQALAKS